jgi:hypothetical protein
VAPVRWLWRVPHRWFTAVAIAIPLGCAIDTQLALTEREQWALAAVVWLVLVSVLLELPRRRQLMVVCFLPMITLAEYVLSERLGWYVYRLENIPPWIIPAHGIVFVTALRVVDTTSVSTRTLAWCAASAQALYGLVNLIVSGDQVGALLSVLYVIGMIVLPDEGKRFYAGLGLVVAYLEIVGSALGVWAWSPEIFGALSETNPPSGAVGGYAMVDGGAVLLAAYAARLVPRLRVPMRAEGLEPPRPEPPAPKAGASTNSATPARDQRTPRVAPDRVAG